MLIVRWHNHLNPEIDKSAWTEAEDELIYRLQQKYGNRWAEIAKYLPGRYEECLASLELKQAYPCMLKGS